MSKIRLKSEDIIRYNACHVSDGELYEGWKVGCEDLVFKDGVDEAMKAKEEEMRIKARNAYCLDSCLVHDVNNKEEIISCSNDGCPFIANFLSKYDQI